MMKYGKLLCLAVLAAVLLTSCAKEKRIVICDGCGKEIQVDVDSPVNDEWILMCDTCEQEVMDELQPGE